MESGRTSYFYFFTGFILYLSFFTAATPAESSNEQDGERINYSVVYIIHGDGGYLYHTPAGQSLQADEKVLREARAIGSEAGNGEVFIFHQEPERKILGIFPQKDRRFYHYRNGELVTKKRYSPEPDTLMNPFAAEARLYNNHRNRKRSPTVFLYFGHEIPEFEGTRYDRSRTGIILSDRRFVEGIKAFKNSSGLPIELAVLSTCNNGTPRMAGLLSQDVSVLLASPQDLHLSHIDTGPLRLLGRQPGIKPGALADSMAQTTFERLTGQVQTVVSLSKYHMNEIEAYITALSDRYFVYREKQDLNGYREANTDCAELPFFKEEMYTRGVKVYYRPPVFGPETGKQSHSGWGCKVAVK